MKHLIYIYFLFICIVSANPKPSTSCAEAIVHLPEYECISRNTYSTSSTSLIYKIRNTSSLEPFILKITKKDSPRNKFALELGHIFKDDKYVMKMVNYSDKGEYLLKVFKFAENGNLAEYMRANPAKFSDWGFVIDFCIKLTEALDYINDEGIVHADVKSQNIVLDQDLNPKFIDFNLAVPIGIERKSRVDIRYSSPEVQLAHEKAVIWSIDNDVYSLGVVLYYIIHKNLPFEIYDARYFSRALKEGKYILHKGIPSTFAEIIRGCLRRYSINRMKMPTVIYLLQKMKREFPNSGYLQNNTIIDMSNDTERRSYFIGYLVYAGLTYLYHIAFLET